MNSKKEMKQAAEHESRMAQIHEERLHTTQEMLESLTGSKRGGTIVNNMFNYVKPAPGPIPWYCNKGHGSIRMSLEPSDKRLPPEYWSCKSEGCKRRISIDRRNKTFLDAIEKIKEIYELRLLQYNHTNDTWKMESAIWLEDRLRGKVKPISRGERNEIIEHFQRMLEDTLEIELGSIKDFFIS